MFFNKAIKKQVGPTLAQKKGSKCAQYLSGSFLFDVKHSDLCLSSPVSAANLQTLETLVEKLKNDVVAKNNTIQQLKTQVETTTELLHRSAVKVNEGRPYSDVGDRQKKRKVWHGWYSST